MILKFDNEEKEVRRVVIVIDDREYELAEVGGELRLYYYSIDTRRMVIMPHAANVVKVLSI